MASTSNILSALFIIGLFLSALILVEIDRLNQASESTKSMQSYTEEKRLEQSFDSLLAMTEPDTGETVGELIADYSYYGTAEVKYGGKPVNYREVLKKLFDSVYGYNNYYLNIKKEKSEVKSDLEIHFIADTSPSMADDFDKIDDTIKYINSKTEGNTKFYLYTLAWTWIILSCSEENVECIKIPEEQITELSKKNCPNTIPPEKAPGLSTYFQPREAYGTGLQIWAKEHVKETDTKRIIIPVSDEPSGSFEFPNFADCQNEKALAALKGYKNIHIFPMITEIQEEIKSGYPFMLEDMEKMAKDFNGKVIDFHKGYSQDKLDKVMKEIVDKYGGQKETPLAIGTLKEDADRYSFERVVLQPDNTPLRFTFWLYKEREPWDVPIKKKKQPPVAIITVNPQIIVKKPWKTFISGLASFDPDGGNIVSYQWEIDGEDNGTNDSFDHTFTSKGNHKIKLTVKDDEGETDTAELIVWVGESGNQKKDKDNDGVPDKVDNCPDTPNPDQKDSDGDGIGDACDTGDKDSDGDGIPDTNDNCPYKKNPDQKDSDGDGIGDACEAPPIGNFNIIYVPIWWNSSDDEQFKAIAQKHFNIWMDATDFKNKCNSKFTPHYIMPSAIQGIPECNITSVCPFNTLDKIANCAKKAVSFPISKQNSRVVGLTKKYVMTCGNASFLGYTMFGKYSVVAGYADYADSSHEMGHTFEFCEQYSQSDWKKQNKELNSIGGCTNYYPDGTTQCVEYGSLTTKCPEVSKGGIDCLGRKIPSGNPNKPGRSCMGPGLGNNILRQFDCFERDHLQTVFDCK